MKPVFVDLHIHTSKNPNELNDGYPLDILKSKVDGISQGAETLISFTDHNTINTKVYLKARDVFSNIIVGAELHIRKHSDSPPYHCHIFFNLTEVDEKVLVKLNKVLDDLYVEKIVSERDDSIPKLESIIEAFNEYDFILLPHAGQSHSTFNKAISKNTHFDSTLERSIYYNHFDGFTARSNNGLGKTDEYFSRLGIKDFVNLVTATDNYSPDIYPRGNNKDSEEFIPTWMLARPTFNGLRLSLSESSRLVYGEKPESWSEHIERVSLKSQNIDIDVKLSSGLNVVIGGSSSGKTLFVDSIWRASAKKFSENKTYADFDVENISIENPAGAIPHYIPQNYIIKICDDKGNIENIPILKSIFPTDVDEREKIERALRDFKKYFSVLVESVKDIEQIEKDVSQILNLSRLIVTDDISDNPLKYILPSSELIDKIKYSINDHEEHLDVLEEIDAFLDKNPLISYDSSVVLNLKNKLKEAFNICSLEVTVRDIIDNTRKTIDKDLSAENKEIQTKREQLDKLCAFIKRYDRCHKKFKESLVQILKISVTVETKKVESAGHILFIENKFALTSKTFLTELNNFLTKEYQLSSLEEIIPENLYLNRFKKKGPKINSYRDFILKVNEAFSAMNMPSYKIITKENKSFDDLSPGWKTSVILDLILASETDVAPLIIDQPEDNLATRYINHGLIDAIKKCKTKKQIILVSHNATIPMLGDAQTVVMCSNKAGHISIKSDSLEGVIDSKDVVGLIADVTDGGKSSIKKRVKKYNLKKFQKE